MKWILPKILPQHHNINVLPSFLETKDDGLQWSLNSEIGDVHSFTKILSLKATGHTQEGIAARLGIIIYQNKKITLCGRDVL